MLSYLIRRLLWALPTLGVASVVIFGLHHCANSDKMSEAEEIGDGLSRRDAQAVVQEKIDAEQQLGLNRPVFYCTVQPHILPDTLHRILPVATRNALRHFALQTGDWFVAKQLPAQALRDGRSVVQLSDSLLAINPPGWHLYWPTLHWHGTDNQYHRWMGQLLRGQLGRSRTLQRPIADELRPAFAHTLLLNGLALLVAYAVALPLGIRMARRADSAFDRHMSSLLLLGYSMPPMWVGGLLIALCFFVGAARLSSGVLPFDMYGGSTALWLLREGPKLLLPVLVLTLHTLVMLTFQLRSGLLEAMQQEYIKTARAKGLSEQKVYYRHALRNALFPLITIFAQAFPAVFGGSVVVETVFNYPGLGYKMQQAFLNNDYPVLFPILMFSAVLIVLAGLLADWLYAWADPRVRFSGQ